MAEIAGGLPGPTILLRADMDALRIAEDTGLEDASEHPGLMHACGHDGHMAALLAAAEFLAQRRERIHGRIRLLFQPGEEGFAGARTMIEHGVLDGGVDGGGAAPDDRLSVRHGRAEERPADGGDGAPLHRHHRIARPCGDASPDPGTPCWRAPWSRTQLQNVVSRRIDPTAPALVHIGTFSVPAKGAISWPERPGSWDPSAGLSPGLSPVLEEAITEIVNGVAAQSGCRIAVRLEEGLPLLVNDSAATKIVRASALKIADPADVFEPKPSMYSEDMAFYLRQVPGCFAYVGAAPRKGTPYPHHHPKFDICEDAIGVAAALLAQVGIDAGKKLPQGK